MDKKKVKRIPSRPPEKFTYTLVKSPSSTTDWNHRYPDCRGCGAASLKAQKSVVPRGGSRRAAVDRGFVKAGYTAYFHPTQKKWYVWNDRSRLLETKKKAEKNHDRNHRVVVDPGDSIMGFDYGVTNFDFPDSDHSEESEEELLLAPQQQPNADADPTLPSPLNSSNRPDRIKQPAASKAMPPDPEPKAKRVTRVKGEKVVPVVYDVTTLPQLPVLPRPPPYPKTSPFSLPHACLTLPSILHTLVAVNTHHEITQPLAALCEQVYFRNGSKSATSTSSPGSVHPEEFRMEIFGMLYEVTANFEVEIVTPNVAQHLLQYFNSIYAEYIGVLEVGYDNPGYDHQWKSEFAKYLKHNRAMRFQALAGGESFTLSKKLVGNAGSMCLRIAEQGDFTAKFDLPFQEYTDQYLAAADDPNSNVHLPPPSMCVYRKKGTMGRINWGDEGRGVDIKEGESGARDALIKLGKELLEIGKNAYDECGKRLFKSSLTFRDLRDKFTALQKIAAAQVEEDPSSTKTDKTVAKLGNVLNHLLSVITLPVYEFQTRGYENGEILGGSQSSVWGTPVGTCYARENKMKPLWAAIKLGALRRVKNTGEDRTFDEHLDEDLNIRRFPRIILADLEKQKHAISSMWERGQGGDVFWLCEFLGTHQFCYCKEEDIVTPFVPKLEGEEGFFDPNYKMETTRAGKEKKVRATKGEIKKNDPKMALALREGIKVTEERHYRRVEDCCGDDVVDAGEGGGDGETVEDSTFAFYAKDYRENGTDKENSMSDSLRFRGPLGRFLLSSNGHWRDPMYDNLIHPGVDIYDSIYGPNAPNPPKRKPLTKKESILRDKQALTQVKKNLMLDKAGAGGGAEGGAGVILGPNGENLAALQNAEVSDYIANKKQRAEAKINNYIQDLAKVEMGKLSCYGTTPFVDGASSGGLLAVSLMLKRVSGVVGVAGEGEGELNAFASWNYLTKERELTLSGIKREEILRKQIELVKNEIETAKGAKAEREREKKKRKLENERVEIEAEKLKVVEEAEEMAELEKVISEKKRKREEECKMRVQLRKHKKLR